MKTKIVNILKKYSNNKKFSVDFSENYSKTYGKSFMLITDLSGTSFTYSFLTKCPVIFYSPKENLFKTNYKNLNHYKDRKKIGLVVTKIDNIEMSIKKLLNNKIFYKKSITKLKGKLDFVGSSKAKIQKEIDKILN